MTAMTDYAALEARVAALEEQMRHVLPSKMDAVAYGLSLVHEDVRATRVAVEGHSGQFDGINQRLDAMSEGLAEILRRLPE